VICDFASAVVGREMLGGIGFMLYTINAIEIDKWEGGKGGTPEKQRIKQNIAKCMEGCLLHTYTTSIYTAT